MGEREKAGDRGAEGRLRGRARQALWLAPAACFALGWLVFELLRKFGLYGTPDLFDLEIYQNLVRGVTSGQVPYRDFTFTYPPGSFPIFLLAWCASLGREELFPSMFVLAMLGCGMLLATTVAWTLARTGATARHLALAVGFVAASPVLVGQVISFRFDLWPALLTSLALAAIVVSRFRLGSGLLGVAIAAKVYPAVIVPIALLYAWKRAGRREAIAAAVCCLVGLGAFLLPLVALAPNGVAGTFVSQSTRPLQVESLPAAVLLVAHGVTGLDVQIFEAFHADNVAGELAADLARLEVVVLAAALLGVWVAFGRGEASAERLLRACAAAVTAFVAFDRVLSPQYLIWLVPLVPLVSGWRGGLAALLLGAALLMTAAYFPGGYGALVSHFEPGTAWTVLIRDVTLVALVAVLALPWPRRLVSKVFGSRRSPPSAEPLPT